MCYTCVVCMYTCVCSLEKWLIPELEQGKYMISLEHFVEGRRKYSKTVPRGHWSQPEVSTGQILGNVNIKTMIVTDYNSLRKNPCFHADNKWGKGKALSHSIMSCNKCIRKQQTWKNHHFATIRLMVVSGKNYLSMLGW